MVSGFDFLFGMNDSGEEWDETVPGDLYADAEEDEGDDAQDAVRGGG